MTSPRTSSGSTANEAIADTKDAATDVAETLKSSAQDVIGKVSGEASRAAHQAQDSAADEVQGVASALRTAADELRSGSPQERTFSQLADGLADASDAMRDKDLGEMMGDLNSFARRNPLVFLGGAALLGFAATRFAKASTRTDHGSSARQDDDSSRYAGSTGSPATSPARPAPSGVTATPSAAPSSAAFRATDPQRDTGMTPGSTANRPSNKTGA